jgi:hypothetical protein
MNIFAPRDKPTADKENIRDLKLMVDEFAATQVINLLL